MPSSRRDKSSAQSKATGVSRSQDSKYPRACESCRRRHVRCVGLPDADSCNSCVKAKRPCLGRNDVVFKMSEYVSGPVEHNITTSSSANLRSHITSKSPEVSVGRASQTPNGHLEHQASQQAAQSPAILHTSVGTSDENFPPRTSRASSPGAEFCDSDANMAADPLGTDPASVTVSAPQFHGPFTNSGGLDQYLQTQTPVSCTPSGIVPDEPTALPSSENRCYAAWPMENTDEAYLLHYFCTTLAPWFDYCDPMNHFETQVVPLAAQDETLMNALLAVSAKHQSRLHGVDDISGDHFQRRCLDILIPSLSNVNASLTTNQLITALVLRLYEEMAEDSPITTHTLDVKLLVKMKRAEIGNSTLCDAVFAVALRQEIFFANFLQRPFQPFTEYCNVDTSFASAGHSSWTLQIIARAAEISNFAYEKGPKLPEVWAEHREYVDEWDRRKPAIFLPARRQKSLDQAFPTIWFISDLQLAAFQHRHLCELLLVALDPSTPLLGLTRTKRRDAKMRTIVREICGAAISNPKWFPAKLTAGLVIAMCGDLFYNEKEQAQLLEILDEAESHVGPPCFKVASRLREFWNGGSELK